MLKMISKRQKTDPLGSPTQFLCQSWFEASKSKSCRSGGAQNLWAKGWFWQDQRYLAGFGYWGREFCQSVLLNCFTDQKCKAVAESKLVFSLSLPSLLKDLDTLLNIPGTPYSPPSLFKDLISYWGHSFVFDHTSVHSLSPNICIPHQYKEVRGAQSGKFLMDQSNSTDKYSKTIQHRGHWLFGVIFTSQDNRKLGS